MQKDGLTWEECAKRWELSVNAVRTRAKQLNIPVAYINKVAHWPGDMLEFGDAFHDWRSENPHAKVHVFLEAVGAPVPDQTKEEVGGKLAKADEFMEAAKFQMEVVERIGERLIAIQEAKAAPAMLRAEMLAKASDQGWIMEKEDLESIGVRGITGCGLEFFQHGYRFIGHYANGGRSGRRVWTCEKMFPKKGQVTPVQSTGRSVGFVADEPTAAMFNFNQPVLPHWR